MSRFQRNNIFARQVTGEQVLQAREKYASGQYTQRQLADELGISTVQMGRILRGESWRNVARPADWVDKVDGVQRGVPPDQFDEAASAARLMERLKKEGL